MNTLAEVKHLCDVTLTVDERQRCEVWTRVLGYHRPVASFNMIHSGLNPIDFSTAPTRS
jgi:hypothetical protein